MLTLQFSDKSYIKPEDGLKSVKSEIEDIEGELERLKYKNNLFSTKNSKELDEEARVKLNVIMSIANNLISEKLTGSEEYNKLEIEFYKTKEYYNRLVNEAKESEKKQNQLVSELDEKIKLKDKIKEVKKFLISDKAQYICKKNKEFFKEFSNEALTELFISIDKDTGLINDSSYHNNQKFNGKITLNRTNFLLLSKLDSLVVFNRDNLSSDAITVLSHTVSSY